MLRAVKLLSGLLLCSVALATGTSNAATLQVDRRGQTPGAYTTLAQAAAVVQPGDTIKLVPGSGPYRETLEIRKHGTSAAPIVIEGNGELVTGFNTFQFSFNSATAQWEYTLPPPLLNTSGGPSNTFRHLVTYQGTRLLISRATGAFTSDLATLSADGLTLILGSASRDGWEIGSRLNGIKVSVSNSVPEAIKLFHIYRNLRVSGAQNDGYNLDGYGTEIRFENIEAFHNFDDGFSAHGSIHCSINGGRFWGNDNGVYNQSRTTLAVDVNDVRAYANLGVGISMRAGSNRLTNSQAWDNGVANISLGGSIVARSVSTYLNRWPQPPFATYQESQGQNINQVYPYTYDAYWKGKTPDATHQAYVLTGEEPAVLPVSELPPFALTYADWRFIYFTSAQIADPATSGESADPDNDSRNNLDEYRLGTRPMVGDSTAVIVSATVPDAIAQSISGDTGTIVLSRSGQTGSALTVYFAMSGDATPGSDYVALDNFVDILAGSASSELSIVPRGGAEAPKLIVLGLLSDPAYVVGPESGTVELDRIDLPVVTLMVPDASASETTGEDGLFRIWRSGSTAQPLTASFAVSGSATPGDDYPALGTSIVFPAGVAAVDLAVVAIADGLSEVTETVTLTLAKTADYQLGGAIGTVKIEGAALPTITLTATDASASEAPGETGTFTITRSSGTEVALTVFFSVAGSAKPGDDYTALRSPVQIPAGASSVVVMVTPVADSVTESAETVVATLATDASYAVGTQKTGTVTISSSALPTVAVTTTDSTASEAPGNVGTFSLSRTGAKTTALTVRYSLSGAASNGVDYASLSGTAVIPGGASIVTVTISALQDTLVEGSEAAVLTISSSAAYVLGSTPSATVTIADVPPPTVSLVVTDGSASESGAGANTGLFTINRTGSKTSPLTVSMTLTGSAIAGADYADPGTSVLIPAGASFSTVTITPVQDTLNEGSETVVLSLAAQPNYFLGAGNTGTVTIANTTAPTVSLITSDAMASETGDGGLFTVSRTGASTAPLTVRFTLGGSATEGADYTDLGREVVIPAGAASVTLAVSPLTDLLIEGNESVVLSLVAGIVDGYVLGTSRSGTVDIADVILNVGGLLGAGIAPVIASLDIGLNNGRASKLRRKDFSAAR